MIWNPIWRKRFRSESFVTIATHQAISSQRKHTYFNKKALTQTKRDREKLTLDIIKRLENNSDKKQVAKTQVRHSVKWNTLPVPAFGKWFNIEMWSLSAISYKREKKQREPNVLSFTRNRKYVSIFIKLAKSRAGLMRPIQYKYNPYLDRWEKLVFR